MEKDTTDQAALQMSVSRARAAIARKRQEAPRRAPMKLAIGALIVIGAAVAYKTSIRAPTPADPKAPAAATVAVAAPRARAPLALDLGTKRERDALPKLDAIERRWADAVKLAGSTARISLAPVVADLQAQRRDVDALEMPPCLATALPHLKSSMDLTLAGLFGFLTEDNQFIRDAVVEKKVAEAKDAFASYQVVKASCTAG